MAVDFDAMEFPEPGSKVGFGQNRLDRDAENRNEQSLPNALSHAACRYYLYAGNRVLIRKAEESVAAFEKKEADTFKPKIEQAILLGHTSDGIPCVAVGVGIDAEALNEPYQMYDFRALLYSASVSGEDASIIAQGGSLLHWHRTNRYCGKCGAPTVSKIGGYRRECTKCEHQIFPRTDPVVIMLAVDGDHCLLGRSPHFPEGWYSTLAGFVEPGESIEAAVRRETFEESGIKVSKVKYYASQPWPFPHSLMIGAHCQAESSEITMDDSELEDCRWFSRDDVKLMLEDKHPQGFKCPPNKAIASAIILAWFEA